MSKIWSSSVDEPYIAVKGIKVTKGMLNFFKETTIKIVPDALYVLEGLLYLLRSILGVG